MTRHAVPVDELLLPGWLLRLMLPSPPSHHELGLGPSALGQCIPHSERGKSHGAVDQRRPSVCQGSDKRGTENLHRNSFRSVCACVVCWTIPGQLLCSPSHRLILCGVCQIAGNTKKGVQHATPSGLHHSASQRGLAVCVVGVFGWLTD